MLISLQNCSKRFSDADLATAAAAIALQVRRDFAPAWGLAPVDVVAGVRPGAAVIVVLDTPDVDGALGYHTEDGGEPDGKVFVAPVLDDAKGCAIYDPANPQRVSVASVLSHEVLELLGDASVNLWVDGPVSQQGSSYAREVCDPCEGDSYVIDCAGAKVSVSDFVLPAWFDTQATGEPVDFLKLLRAPFTLRPGGYMVVRDVPGTSRQVFGETHTPRQANSRRARRCSKDLDTVRELVAAADRVLDVARSLRLKERAG